MKHANSRNERFYRKGLLLGFTMAEIMVLVIFCILITLAAALLRKEELIGQLENVVGQDPQRVARVFDAVTKRIPIRENIDEQVRELELVLKRAEEASVLQEEVVKLREELDNLKEIRELILKQGEAGAEQEIAEAIVAGHQIKEIAAAQQPPVSVSELKPLLENASQAASQLRELKAQNETLNGQLINLTERLGGRGTEYPPCWVSANGKIEYIFDIALTTDGYIIRDRQLPNRVTEQAALPLTAIRYNTTISSQSFLGQTNALLNWSKEHNCRFFVRIYDQTGSDEKDRFKFLQRTLQQNFYSYEVMNERF